MNINVRVLGWKDMCCGCNTIIGGTQKVFIVGNVSGISGTLHFCEKCIDEISDSKQQEVIKDTE